ncbi:MAG: hypothetical protein HQ518_26905 [Rhodopirellula sp.]|nr:hypothetical protein [Rhodopirellula sp.]
MLHTLILDESGFVISAELTVIFTLVFCAAVVGFAVIRDSLAHEMHDVSEAIGAVSQSYNITGLRKARNDGNYHARCSGFGFNDRADNCDCVGITLTTVSGKNDPSLLNVPEGTNG